jgi:hypothetical protein
MNGIMTKTKCRSRSERGVALIIAIFSLMLISVVATALIVTSGTQSALKSNYKSAMHAFYDARAGLEEARGRLWASNPDSAAIINCVFPGGVPMLPTKVCYVTNGNDVNPTDPSNAYADNEYSREWPNVTPDVQLIPSTSATAQPAGLFYKWVRITPRTEGSANFDCDGDGIDTTTALFFDGKNVIDSKHSLPPGAAQILTITSLAVTPYGSQRMLQYTVAPASFLEALPTFPSALTLDGTGVQFNGSAGGNQGSGNGTFQVNGKDSTPSATSPGIPAIGYTNSNDGPAISAAAVPSNNYLSPHNIPPVGIVTLPPMLQTPSGLDRLVQSITQNADSVLNPPSGTAADQTSLPSAMSASPQNPNPTPMIVVVNGDFNLHGHGTGYGLLLVTGTLDYDPDASWNGVILVIGKGIFTSTKLGVGVINGAVFVAQTRDSYGNLLSDPSLMHSSFTQTGGGNGIHYSSSLVKTTQALMPYQVLSFREIDQTIR